MIISAFLSKVLSDCFDITKSKIKKFVENKTKVHRTIEGQIYTVIVNTFTSTTYNRYDKNMDLLYETAEKLLRDIQKNKMISLEILKPSLKNIYDDVNENTYEQFKLTLYKEIINPKMVELYQMLQLFAMENEYAQFSKIENIENIMDRTESKVDRTENKIDRMYNELIDHIKTQSSPAALPKSTHFENTKNEDYRKIWNGKLFLHADDIENPLTLKEAYIFPDFVIKKNDIDYLFTKTLNNLLEEFINFGNSSTMLICGVPGIGKSTIVSWIADKFENDSRILILRFQQFEREKLNNGLLNAVCATLKCTRENLNNKTLILDGFDEIKLLDARNELIKAMICDILDISNFKLIVTSRSHYIEKPSIFKNVIEILPFKEKKITSFYFKIKCQHIEEKSLNNTNLEVLGIPVILYMAIMSDIDITKPSSKPELYDKIFAVEGGIFDRFAYNGKAFMEGNQIFRNPDNITKYLSFLQEVSFKMFQKNSFILDPKEIDPLPTLEYERNHVSIWEFPIKYLFEKSNSTLEFIHLSIYEYFASEFIYTNIINFLKNNQKTEDIAGFLGNALSSNKLSKDILEFLKYKFESDEYDAFKSIYNSFDLMQVNGMTSFSNKCYKNVVECEQNTFENLINIIKLCPHNSIKLNSSCRCYINNRTQELDLSYIDMNEINLNHADLTNCNLNNAKLNQLIGTNLTAAHLKNAVLNTADLRGAILVNATLIDAHLYYSNLTNANLFGANLTGADLSYANLTGADLREANLNNVKFLDTILEDSIWDEYSINKYKLQLKKSAYNNLRIYKKCKK